MLVFVAVADVVDGSPNSLPPVVLELLPPNKLPVEADGWDC